LKLINLLQKKKPKTNPFKNIKLTILALHWKNNKEKQPQRLNKRKKK